MTEDRKPIPREFSIYLDALRFFAALYVLFFHIRKQQIGPMEVISRIPDHGHDAVILFFVLSGYVIAAATDRKKGLGLREYVLDRSARVYSVAVPTLLFCAFVVIFFQPIWESGNRQTIAQVALNSLANLFFVAQSWSWKIWVYVNQPYWSLCYEVMYYAGFGVFMFMRGWQRWLGLLVVALVAGPKVLLLLPCWIMGVLAYRLRDRWPLSMSAGVAIGFVIPPLVLVAFHYAGFGPAVRNFSESVLGNQKDYLEFSNDFLVDYVTAILVALNLYAARYVPIRLSKRMDFWIVGGADMSFTLYLMHLPLVFIILNISGELRSSMLALVFAAVGVPLVCYMISLFTERQRPRLRAWLDRVLP
jgi:peptidoglycan/LPS O-acetylase OafA/YrhL